MDAQHLRSLSINSAVSTVLEREEERPVRCAKFRRQEMWAYKPVWSPMVVAIMYLTMSVILIPIGVVIFTQSSGLMQTKLLRYDSPARCSAEAVLNGTRNPDENNCLIHVDIPKATKGNVFMYYGMVNFYQNKFRYARSRSYDQLRGRQVNKDSLKSLCKPDADLSAPCGLSARTQFNDTFTLCKNSSCNAASIVNVTSKNIAWEVDRNTLYKNSSRNTAEQNAQITSEDFMVWMRLSPYRTWFKLYRRIEEPLERRRYYMLVDSNFPVESFGGQKFFYLAETTWFGGPNKFLGLACIAVGSLSLLLAIIYSIRSRFAPEPPLPPEAKDPWLDNSSDSISNNVANLRRGNS